jgi:Skp family chaperone for outer membrane proteins
MRTKLSKTGVLLVALVVGTLAVLPAAAQSKASAKNVESLNAVLKEIEKGKTQVQGAMDALTAMVAGGEANLQKNYNAFTKQVSSLNKTRTTVQARAADMQTRREAYLAEWQKKSQEVTNPEIQAHMQQRAEAVKTVMESLQPAGEALKEAFPPFFSDLNDVQKMLSVDLSPAGVSAAKPIGDKVVANGNIIVKNLDTYITTLTQIRDQIAPKAKK